MFEKPRLETFSYFLAPSIDNSQANRERVVRGWIICSIFVDEISRHLLFAGETLSRGSSFLSFFVSLRVDGIHGRVRMYRECTLTITAPHAFIAHLGGAHTIAILLAD